PADDDGELHAALLHVPDLLGDAPHRVVVDAVRSVAEQRLAAQLENNAIEHRSAPIVRACRGLCDSHRADLGAHRPDGCARPSPGSQSSPTAKRTKRATVMFSL